VYGLVLSIFVPIVYAAPQISDFTNVFKIGGQFLEQLFQSEYGLFAITVILATMMFYNIFVPLISKIPVFKGGDKGGPANKYGKVVSLCMAIMASLGIFGVIILNGGSQGVRGALNSWLGPFATLAGIVMALLFFGLIYFGFKDADESDRWKRALWGAGLCMVFIGMLLAKPFLHSLGWLIVFILLMMFLFKGKGDGGGKGKDKDKDKDKDGDDKDGDDKDKDDDDHDDNDWYPEITLGDTNPAKGVVHDK